MLSSGKQAKAMKTQACVVFIPAYKQPALLKRCINSVLNSLSARIVILDDSDDNSIRDCIAEISKTWGTDTVEYIECREIQARTSHISSWNRYQDLTNRKASEHNLYINVRHHDDHLLARQSQRIAEDLDWSTTKAMIIHPIMTPALKMGRMQLMRYHCPPPLQSLLIKHLPHELIILFNYIGPTACVWVRQDLALNAPVFNEKLQWLVDVEWYYSLASRCKPSEITISRKAMNSSVTNTQSITKQLRPQIAELQHKELMCITERVRISPWIHLLAAILRPVNRLLSWMLLEAHLNHDS